MKRFLCILILLFNILFSGYSQDKMLKSDSVYVCNTVEFVVNTDRIIENNKYETFINKTVPFIKDHKDDIETILLVGSASPEGNVTRNKYLAKIRAEKIYSYFRDSIERHKINIIDDYNLFLEKTGISEKNWKALRATYIEVRLRVPEIIERVDTIYIKEIDTVYCWRERVDTIYIKEKPKHIPILAVKTNLVSDVLATPNVQAELYTWLWGLSLEFDYTFPWWHKDYDSYFYYQILNGTAGIRKYLNNRYTGHYIGIYANTAIYDICPWDKDLGWQGELHGAGISYGYVFQNKKHPRIKFEPYIRFGWFNTRYDTYHASQPWDEKYYYNWYLRASDFVPRRFNMNYFGPTEIGFNFTFDLICIRKY